MNQNRTDRKNDTCIEKTHVSVDPGIGIERGTTPSCGSEPATEQAAMMMTDSGKTWADNDQSRFTFGSSEIRFVTAWADFCRSAAWRVKMLCALSWPGELSSMVSEDDIGGELLDNRWL